MRALTIRQPYAQMIIAGTKQIETRSWQTSHRGLLAIHAGQRWSAAWDRWYNPDHDDDDADRVNILDSLGVSMLCGNDGTVRPDRASLPTGAVIGVVHLAETLPISATTIASPHLLVGDDSLWVCDEQEWVDVTGVGDFAWQQGAAVPAHGELPLGDYTPGSFGWGLARPYRCARPVAAVGRQGLWRLPDDVAAQVATQVLDQIGSRL